VFLGIHISVPLRLPSLSLLCSSARCAAAALPPMCSAPAASAPLWAAPRALPCLAAALPTPRWPAPVFPTSHRRCPCRHARRRSASSCSHATTSPSRPRAHPGAPRALTLVFAHTYFAHFPLFRPPPLTGPPPRFRLTVVSHPRHLRSPIQCYQSITLNRWYSSTHPISLSHTVAPSPMVPAKLLFRRRSASPSPRRCRAASLQPRASAALHRLIEAT
jgi:hypothetical protein